MLCAAWVGETQQLFGWLLQVVAGDPFNSDPEDEESMSDDVRQRVRAGEKMQVSTHPLQ